MLKRKVNNLEYQSLYDPIIFIACGFGSGLSRIGPGTCGTIVAIPIFLLIGNLNIFLYFGLCTILFFIGVRLCDYAEDKLKQKDHPAIVWDEIVGILLPLYFVPHTFFWILYVFILFRFFDIIKPWPIKSIETHVKGGMSVMLDDLLAGIMTLIVLVITFLLV